MRKMWLNGDRLPPPGTGTDRPVPVPGGGSLSLLKDTGELKKEISMAEKKEIRVQTRVRLVVEEPCWGRGTRMMMQGVEETGSVRDACRQTGISYSKGRKIIARAERGFGSVLVESHQGGAGGGLSRLTEEGRRRKALYEELEREVQAFAERKYEELESRYFSESE